VKGLCSNKVGPAIQLEHSRRCIITIYAPMVYMAPCVFDAGRYITWASGRGLGPGNGIKPIGECHLGPKH
jgi:hypothetical protein